jgi:hypothetical protein
MAIFKSIGRAVLGPPPLGIRAFGFATTARRGVRAGLAAMGMNYMVQSGSSTLPVVGNEPLGKNVPLP